MSQRQMRLTTEQEVMNATNPQQAMLALACTLDRIEDALEQLFAAEAAPPEINWGNWAAPATLLPDKRGPEGQRYAHDWDDHEAHIEAAREFKSQVDEQKAKRIEAVETLLADATDPDEIRALEAKLRLVKDNGGSLGNGEVDGNRVAETDGNLIAGSPTQAISVGGSTVELPIPTKEQRLVRRAWANGHKLWEFIPLEAKPACDAFAKGGPMWLYLGNRDAVMAMPVGWRQELVQMIQEDSPAQAAEVGRDILMQRGEQVDPDIAIQLANG